MPHLLLRALLTGLWLLAASSGHAQSLTFPKEFKSQSVASNGTTIYVRVGGSGPAVVLLHGYGETGDMWVPLAADLARDHTVIVPDLRGMGLSAPATGGFDKKNQARDVAGVLAALKVARIELVAHDIGNMVAFAYATANPQSVTRLVLCDAPVPGVGPWDEILKSPLLWHFRFGGPDMERLVAGRERIYLDRFWNEFSAEPSRFTESARVHYAALYARPGAMRAGFAQFAAFDQDALDNRAWLATGARLRMPVLAVGGEKSFGPMMATVMRAAAMDVKESIVPGSGHWVMEENPRATTALVRAFLGGTHARFAPDEIKAFKNTGASEGTSGVAGIETRVLKGDPTQSGLYTIQLTVPANTTIQAHVHPDDRMATVISGTWYFGYGERFDPKLVKALPAGSFYLEPPNEPHFARTGETPVVLQISGFGPTGTQYVK
jgi:pimeloyl-ACP methyl ester carboxylesterase/quercetin dioxygenase-like cupin family protein